MYWICRNSCRGLFQKQRKNIFVFYNIIFYCISILYFSLFWNLSFLARWALVSLAFICSFEDFLLAAYFIHAIKFLCLSFSSCYFVRSYGLLFTTREIYSLITEQVYMAVLVIVLALKYFFHICQHVMQEWFKYVFDILSSSLMPFYESLLFLATGLYNLIQFRNIILRHKRSNIIIINICRVSSSDTVSTTKFRNIHNRKCRHYNCMYAKFLAHTYNGQW